MARVTKLSHRLPSCARVSVSDELDRIKIRNCWRTAICSSGEKGRDDGADEDADDDDASAADASDDDMVAFSESAGGAGISSLLNNDAQMQTTRSVTNGRVHNFLGTRKISLLFGPKFFLVGDTKCVMTE